jgi:hypothetical protein
LQARSATCTEPLHSRGAEGMHCHVAQSNEKDSNYDLHYAHLRYVLHIKLFFDKKGFFYVADSQVATTTGALFLPVGY